MFATPEVTGRKVRDDMKTTGKMMFWIATAALGMSTMMAAQVPTPVTNNGDVKHDVRDIRHDRKDIRHDRRDVARDKRDIRHDRRDVRADRKDVRHDRRDLRKDLRK